MQGLEGVKVLELGHMVSAAYATKLMADLGADVIKVDFAQASHKGKEIKSRPDMLVFGSLAEMARALTPRRLELLGLIRRHQPESVRELAARAHRDMKNVSEMSEPWNGTA